MAIKLKDRELLEQDTEIVRSPQWKLWESQGRTNWGGRSAGFATTMRNQLLAEDKQIANYYELATGDKATPVILAQYAQYAHDPALLASAIEKTATLGSVKGTFGLQIAKTTQEKLGRMPTDAELNYFGKQMESGALDAYGLSEFLGGTTEYQTKQADTARGKLAEELGTVDTAYLQKIQKTLESKYAALGRPGASAFGTSLVTAGKELAGERAGYLAGLGYQDFQKGQENLRADYQNRLAQMYARQQAVAQLGGESRQRYYSQQDFGARQAATERLMRLQQPRQGSFLQNLLPGVIQAGATLGGAALGRPLTYNYYYGGIKPG